MPPDPTFWSSFVTIMPCVGPWDLPALANATSVEAKACPGTLDDSILFSVWRFVANRELQKTVLAEVSDISRTKSMQCHKSDV